MEREEAVTFLKQLQTQICSAFQTLEPTCRFQATNWDYKKGSGGGQMRVLRGDVFEKAAVNFSCVMGENFPMQDSCGPFFATGISLITHMKNPHAPTVHMNIRYMETKEKKWLGGGYDLTPMGFFYEEDTNHFHLVAKQTLDQFDQTLYPKFSQNAKEYFYIPHRQKERGVGGIFFDHFNSGDPLFDFGVWRAVGETFTEAIMPIYNKRIQTSYSEEEKELQAIFRAHYVEFNLIYDRGTKFGFQSNGNPEAILCSMPPSAKW